VKIARNAARLLANIFFLIYLMPAALHETTIATRAIPRKKSAKKSAQTKGCPLPPNPCNTPLKKVLPKGRQNCSAKEEALKKKE